MSKILILSAVIGIIGSGTAAMAQNPGGAGSTVVGEDHEVVRQVNREPGVTTGSVHPFDTEQQVNRGMKRDRMLSPNAEEAATVAESPDRAGEARRGPGEGGAVWDR